jgi:hypothetical protein
MSRRTGTAVDPLARWFLEEKSSVSLVFDFCGPTPALEPFAARALDRAAELPVLNRLLPDHRVRSWPLSGAPLAGPVHVRHHRPSRLMDLDEATNRILREALPGGAHPAWDVWLLEDPTDDGRFRVCCRVHHGLLDGVGAANVALALLADQGVLGPCPHRPALPTPRGALATAAGVALSRRRVRHWAELPTERSPNGHFPFRDVPEQLARTLAEAYGTSVNDVSLAAPALALRGWRLSSADPEECPDMPVLCR